MKENFFGRIAAVLAVAPFLWAAGQCQAEMQKAKEPYVSKPEIRFTIAAASAGAEGKSANAAPNIEYSNVIVLGELREKSHAFVGAAEATLRDAVRAIAPPAFAVRSSICVPMQAPAAYRSGTDWVAALNEVARANDVDVTVDHDSREVLLVRKSPVKVDAKRTWAILASDTTVKRALERWTGPACWNVQWDVPYPMETVSDTFYRDMTLLEALSQLEKDLESSKSPVRIVPFRNNLVRVYLDSTN